MSIAWKAVIGVLLGSILAGCNSLGPATVTRDRLDYNNALATSWKEQLLQNIVRLRYMDTVQFMDVSSIVSGYTLQAQLQANATQVFSAYPFFAQARTTGLLGAAAMYQDRPTISYTPVVGKKFNQTLIEPIPPFAIFSLVMAGYPVDVVLPATVRALNGVYNRTYQAGVARPAEGEFATVVAALRRIQNARALSVQSEKRGGQTIVTVRLNPRRKTEITADVEIIRRTLNLTPNNGDIILTYGAAQRRKDELAVLSRSLVEIMGTIAGDIRVPAQHVSEGRTFPTTDDSTYDRSDLSRVKIESGASAPDDAFAAVRYNNVWYWISDRDLTSKRAFTFLLLFFSLAETGTVPAAPQLTIPVQ